VAFLSPITYQVYVQGKTVWNSRNIYTASAIVTSWYNFIRRKRVYRELLSLATKQTLRSSRKVPQIVVHISQIWYFSTDFRKSTKWNFTKIRPVTAAMVYGAREKNRRMVVSEVIWTFRDYAIEAKNQKITAYWRHICNRYKHLFIVKISTAYIVPLQGNYASQSYRYTNNHFPFPL
jgi:hypothetical protein